MKSNSTQLTLGHLFEHHYQLLIRGPIKCTQYLIICKYLSPNLTFEKRRRVARNCLSQSIRSEDLLGSRLKNTSPCGIAYLDLQSGARKAVTGCKLINKYIISENKLTKLIHRRKVEGTYLCSFLNKIVWC